ncbi:DUF5372 family protein [Streptomyces capitiformicae]|uniref:Uncharacterized protein n=1 Tax=Streptomyces capitiformicae TaxID=2014920 RepID=A0A919GHN1_9ACTN|nr:DUF5372 family protein [Streptomyces capitiformicae]GHH84709.1 hypothetical protein GCM10017771_14640 [Streptomyces capitiformicae]
MQLIRPFHPRCGEDFEFLERLNSWRGDVVLVLDGQGHRCSFPLEWTDMAPVDAFVAAAGGGCPYRTGDLVELADLVAARVPGGRGGVGGMAP